MSPEHIVLDTEDLMHRFMTHSNVENGIPGFVQKEYVEEYLDETISRVFDCLHHDLHSASDLMSYTSELRGNAENVGGVAMPAMYRIADAVYEFGMQMSARLDYLNAYKNNRLDYYYSGRIGVGDIILSRFPSLQPLDQLHRKIVQSKILEKPIDVVPKLW